MNACRLALVLLAMPVVARTQVVFEPPVASPLVHVAQGVLSADLNLDGHADLITLPRKPEPFAVPEISVLLGSGDGTFGEPMPTFLGAGADRAGRGAVTFLNDDAFPDLVLPVAANLVTTVASSLLLMFGAGDGTFPTVQIVGVAADADVVDVVPVDVSGDGKLDFVMLAQGPTIFSQGKLLVLVAAGAGYTLVSGPTLFVFDPHLALGDVNGDGLLDAVVGTGNKLLVAAGLGAAGFAAPTSTTVGGSVGGMVLTDTDGDTVLDLVLTDGGHVVSLRGDGAAHFTPIQSVAVAGARALSAGSIDHDAALDLLVSKPDTHEVAVLRGGGDGTFSAGVTVSHVTLASGSALADFDEDGTNDAAVASFAGPDTFHPFSSVFVIRNHTYPATSPFTDLGAVLPGSLGWPIQLADGDLQPGTTVRFRLANALPSGHASLVLGFSQVNVPFKGGVMVPSVDVLISGLPIGAGGALELGGGWPSGVPTGFTFFVQYWFKDAAAPTHEAGTSAVRVIAP